MKCYPILIPTLNRFSHFKECVESLAKCSYASQTDLFIGLDYPPSQRYEEGYLKIKNYVQSIVGFKTVNVFERSTNFGAIENLRSLIEVARASYDGYILIEDDNIVAPTFLEFMNTSMIYFQSVENIKSVCGFLPTSQYNYQKDYLITSDSSGWGIGRWFKKYHIAEKEYPLSVLQSFKKSWKLYKSYPASLLMLMEMVGKGAWYGDTVRTVENIEKGFFQIRPAESLVKNMGHDGTGLHCGYDDFGFSNQILSDRKSYIITSQSKGGEYSKKEFFFQGFNKSKYRSILSIGKIWIKYTMMWLKLNQKF